MSHGDTKGGSFVPPSPEDLDLILDAYEFLELLGRGGMGAVYKARQKSLDRLVAIKILPPGLIEGDDAGDGFFFAERFQREARAMAKLCHPNIIGVYDFGQAGDGQFFFVMEYIEGTDLHSLIQGGGLTIDHVSGWIYQICDALQYAHARGIVHRDIKPANIMVTREGQVKVADFGLAKLTGTEEVQTKLTMTNMAMGTPDYVAPEALEAGMEVDHRADLYAVGVMLYEMLTGKVPRGAWKAASTQIPGLDPRYDDLIERAMDADREGRFQNASEISATIYEIATTAWPTAPVEEEELPPANSRIKVESPARSAVGRSARAGPGASPLSPSATMKSKSRPGFMALIALAVLVVAGGGFVWLKKERAIEAGTGETPGLPAIASAGVPPLTAIPQAPARSVASSESFVIPVDRFAGVQFPRDLKNPASKAWRFDGSRILLDRETPGEFPSFVVPVAATGNHEFEMEFSKLEEEVGLGYLRIMIPVREGWISVQANDDEVILFSEAGRNPVKVLPTDAGVIRKLIVNSSDDGNGALVRVRLDGKVLIEMPVPGLREMGNWENVSREFISIGGETKGKSSLAIHAIRVSPGTTGPPMPSSDSAPPPRDGTTEGGADKPFNETMTRLLDGVDEIDFENLILGAFDVTGSDVTPLFSSKDGQVFGLAVDPQDEARPRVVAVAHGYFLHELRAQPVCRRFFQNSLDWLGGERDPVLLISPDELMWGSKPWATQNGYQIASRPPTGGGGVLILAENHSYDTEEKRTLIQELLPKVDGVFVSTTSWANIDYSRFPQHPANEIFEPFGFKLLYRRIGPIGKWTRPAGLPEWSPSIATVPSPESNSISLPNATPKPGDPLTRITAAGNTDPRLGQLATGFLARLEKDAEGPFRAALAGLDQSYVANGLARARTAAQARGSLEEVTAIDREKARVESGQPIPSADEATLVDSLKELRSTYREALGKLTSERNDAAGPVYDLYLGALDAYVAELTKENEIDRARAVKSLRDEVAALKPTPPSDSPAAPPVGATTAPSSVSAGGGTVAAAGPRPDREVAVSILTLGGTVRISKGGAESDAKRIEDLPTGRIEILEFQLDRLNSNRPPLEKADFSGLIGPKTLHRVWVRPGNARPGDESFTFLAGNKDLDHLHLEGTELVTEIVLDHLLDSTKLRFLGIQYATGFTGVGLSGHPVAKSLTAIDFLGSGITDEGLEAIATCSELTTLRVTSLEASDEGFASLGSLSKLRELTVEGTAFGDKAALALSSLPEITVLNLVKTAVTDRGIACFAEAKQLRTLNVRDCDLSERAIEALRAALPDCQIDF